MKCDPKDLLLYAVTDRHWLNGRTLVDVVKESLDGGVTMIQLREKSLDEGKFLEEAKELQALHGGLDSINEHVSGMIRDFAAHVDSKQEEFAANAKRVTAARDRVREMMDQKRLSLEDGAKERFANFERILNEAASYLPDVSALRKEVEEAKAKYDRQSEELRKTRERRLLRAEHALRNNPTAASRRHKGPFEQLKRIQQRDEEKKHSA